MLARQMRLSCVWNFELDFSYPVKDQLLASLEVVAFNMIKILANLGIPLLVVN
jgi:hypothetical protein